MDFHELQRAVAAQFHSFDRQSFAVEQPAAKAAPARGIVDQRDAVGEHLLAQLAEQEAGLAGDRRAVDRAGEMAEQA